jgi:hypothetical protein
MKTATREHLASIAVEVKGARAVAAAFAIWAATGCTKHNPRYCDSQVDCPNGQYCDVEHHGCMPNLVDSLAGTADATPPDCDVTKPFAPAAEVPGLRDPMANDVHAALTSNQLTIYFASNRSDYSTTYYIYRANRPTRDASFETPMIVALGGAGGAQDPAISADGNTIYFVTYKTNFGPQIMTSTRPDSSTLFPTPTEIAGESLVQPSLTADGQTLYVSNEGSGRIARLQKLDGTFGPANDVDTQLSYTQISPTTSDDLTLYLTLRNGALHATRRTSTTALWPTPTPVTELNTQNEEWLPSWVSADGCRLYLTYAPAGNKSRIYMAARPK